MQIYDFYSDTKTKPSRAMREAVLNCEVGDEQKNEDPTANELCRRVAELLGKESAVFLPSGTMCNEIAVNVHTQPGDEVICEETCHIINFQSGGIGALSGVMPRAIPGKFGIFTADQVRERLRSSERFYPRSTLLNVEHTTNMGGGAIWPLDQLDEVAKVAKAAGLATHLDGARLLNACVKTGISAARYAQEYDSVWIDFTKGLGAPVGAVLAGTEDFIAKAWRLKQRFGGAMRQSGILASMCLYALDHNVDRLADDNDLAERIGKEIASLPQVSKVFPVETNIVIFEMAGDAPLAKDMLKLLAQDGILAGEFGERRLRVVTHHDVDQNAANALMAALRKHLGAPAGA